MSFQILGGNGYVTVRLIGACDNYNIKGFTNEAMSQIAEPFPHVVVNCEHLSSLSTDWLRSLLQLQVKLKTFNKQMRFIGMQAGVKSILKKKQSF